MGEAREAGCTTHVIKAGRRQGGGREEGGGRQRIERGRETEAGRDGGREEGGSRKQIEEKREATRKEIEEEKNRN